MPIPLRPWPKTPNAPRGSRLFSLFLAPSGFQTDCLPTDPLYPSPARFEVDSGTRIGYPPSDCPCPSLRPTVWKPSPIHAPSMPFGRWLILAPKAEQAPQPQTTPKGLNNFSHGCISPPQNIMSTKNARFQFVFL